MNTGFKKIWRKRRYNEQEGLCYWCKGPMILIESFPPGSTPIRNMCTIDHLRNPYEGERLNNSKSVAACFDCNHERGRKDEQANMAVHRVKSANHHRPLSVKLSELIQYQDR